MDRSVVGQLVVAMIGLILGLAALALVKSSRYQVEYAIEQVHNEAVRAGAAIRVVDQETGAVRIEWRGCK